MRVRVSNKCDTYIYTSKYITTSNWCSLGYQKIQHYAAGHRLRIRLRHTHTHHLHTPTVVHKQQPAVARGRAKVLSPQPAAGQLTLPYTTTHTLARTQHIGKPAHVDHDGFSVRQPTASNRALAPRFPRCAGASHSPSVLLFLPLLLTLLQLVHHQLVAVGGLKKSRLRW